jgi:hypothetical protein
MRTWIATCLLLLAASAWLSPAEAQARSKTRITAHLAAGVVKLGSTTVLVVGVEDAQSARLLELPKVEGLELGPMPRPQQRDQVSYINGQYFKSSEVAWVVPVNPLREGDFTIPALELEVDGKRVSTSPLSLKVVADLRGEELGHFEIRCSAPKLVEGQPFVLELRFGYDEGLAQKINLRNLLLSWWGQLPGVLEQPSDDGSAGARAEHAFLNSEERLEVESLGSMEVRGRKFRMYRLVRDYVATRAGTLEIPASFFEFARLVRASDFFGSPEKVESYFVKAQPLRLEVAPLPEAGRPLGFGGAIGRFQARADAQPRDVDQGDSIQFTVEWSGEGNLRYFTPPDPSRSEAFAGFRCYGSTETKEHDRRTVVYDLAPLSSDVREIPALAMDVFDPAAWRYAVVRTQPIPIRVRAVAGATGLDAPEERGFELDLEDIVAAPRAQRSVRAPSAAVVGAALALLPALALGLRGVARRRGDPDRPIERRRRAARRVLERALERASDPDQRQAAFQAYLAARTRETEAAWLGRRALAWRETCGLPMVPSAATTSELDRALAELERAVWGGGGPGPDAAALLALARQLEKEGL